LHVPYAGFVPDARAAGCNVIESMILHARLDEQLRTRYAMASGAMPACSSAMHPGGASVAHARYGVTPHRGRAKAQSVMREKSHVCREPLSRNRPYVVNADDCHPSFELRSARSARAELRRDMRISE